MGLASDKVSEIRAQIKTLEGKLAMLEADGGKVLRFLDSIHADGSLTDLPSMEIVARIIHKWLNFEG